jgi:hypothetical protein
MLREGVFWRHMLDGKRSTNMARRKPGRRFAPCFHLGRVATILALLTSGLTGLTTKTAVPSAYAGVSWSQARVLDPSQPLITDRTASSFGVVWISTQPTQAALRYGADPSALSDTVYDDRDPAQGPPVARRVHRFTVSGLQTSTSYYFILLVDGQPQSGAAYTVPASRQAPPSLPNTVAGTLGVTGGTGLTAGSVLLLGQWQNPDGSTSAPVSALNLLSTSNPTTGVYDINTVPLAANNVSPFSLASGATFTLAAYGDLAGQLVSGGPVSATWRTPLTLMPPLTLSVASPPSTATATPFSQPVAPTTPPIRGPAPATATDTAIVPATATTPPRSTSTPTVSPTTTASPSTATATPLPPSPTTIPRRTTPIPASTAVSRTISSCGSVAIPALAQVQRNSIQALLVGAGPSSPVALTVLSHSDYPAHLRVYTQNGQGTELAGAHVAAGYRYRFSLGAAAIALVVFVVPRSAPLATTSLTVVAQPFCRGHGLLSSTTSFRVRAEHSKPPDPNLRLGKATLRFTLPSAFARTLHITRQTGMWARVQAARVGAKTVSTLVVTVTLKT